MKVFKILLASSLLISTTAIAFTAKVEKSVLAKGTSIGKYAKPGAPVNITYTSEHVSMGDISKVDIVLSTNVTTGKMKVKVKVDKGLDEISDIEKHLSFDLSDGKKEYPLHLEVSAAEDGLYYVKLLVSIKGQGMRAFAVPVYVGDGTLRAKKRAVEKTTSGEIITVSPAQESIVRE
ncbi:hypothetical protein [Sulfurovum sp.]|uniref:hypothetical protein n=1 Tax=Sulfurovum sp. TaxID=1969726 RepID=UPI002867E03A|nr:hypothetical protein [Sulfurovum sp.]